VIVSTIRPLSRGSVAYPNTDDPNTKEYFTSGDNKESLEDRDCVRNQGQDWWTIDKAKEPDRFEQPKIIMPDIAYYNNYWVDKNGDFYCLDTTYYISPVDETLVWYLAGVLNSDVAQFYIRRNAATYRGDYLRYKSDYVGDIPIPDPEDTAVDAGLVTEIADLAERIQEETQRVRDAETLLDDPEALLNEAGVETVPLTRTAYVTRLPDEPDEYDDSDLQLSLDGNTLLLNIHQQIEFDAPETAEAFRDLLNALNINSVSDVFDAEYPRTTDDIIAVLDEHVAAEDRVTDAGEHLQLIEDELNDAVYELFDVSEEQQALIEDCVITPENPLKSKVR